MLIFARPNDSIESVSGSIYYTEQLHAEPRRLRKSDYIYNNPSFLYDGLRLFIHASFN